MARGKKVGRTIKLTPTVSASIVKSIAGGTPRKYAAQAAGTAESTLRSWSVRGKRDKKGPFPAFLAEIRTAEAKFIESNVATIRKARDGVDETTIKVLTGPKGVETTKTVKRVIDWAAAAFFLERFAFEEFSTANKEIAALKKQLAAVTEKLETVMRHGADQPRTPPAGTGGSPAGGAS
jgi:hypothetical protein